MTNKHIMLYEELAMNAHPALKTQLYDGWILRFSSGYTNRANSVNPLYPSTLPLEEKVEVCEGFYTKQKLPTVFKLTEASPPGLDAILDARGYDIVTPTYLFTNHAQPSGKASKDVTITHAIEPAWRADFFRLNGLADTGKIATASAMMDNIQGDVLCARMVEGGQTIACGLCVVERGYAGLYDIVVDAAHRGRGHGFALCSALGLEAANVGAHAMYLQVVAANAPAVALYKKLGYQCSYPYWYRVKKKQEV